MDLLTTIAFLRSGVSEANPFINALLQRSSSPWHILIALKLIAIALAYYCWRIQKEQLLARVTLFYAFVVAWNIMALIAGAGSA